MGEYLERRADDRPAAEIGEGIGRVRQHSCTEIGHRAGTRQHRFLHFISVIEHCVPNIGKHGRTSGHRCAAQHTQSKRTFYPRDVPQAGLHAPISRALREVRTSPSPPPMAEPSPASPVVSAAKPAQSRRQLGNLRMVWQHASRYPRQIATALLALLVTSAATIAIPYGFKKVIDRGFGPGADGSVATSFHYLLMIVVVLALATAGALLLCLLARRARSSPISASRCSATCSPSPRASSRRIARRKSPRA